MRVVENTPAVHNVVCCTLCSCYPWPVLGLPPAWYKSLAYRARIVREPRAVLREFGLDLPQSVEVRVWDSSAEMRYLVLPERPPETAGMNEEELVPLITRDSLIGVARVKVPRALGLVFMSRVADRIAADRDSPAAIPRRNGEPVFNEPWESRVFAIAVVALRARFVRLGRVPRALIAEISAADRRGDRRHYYERF